MSEVVITTIGNVCSRFSSGKSIPSTKISDEGFYPVFGGNGIRGYTDTYNFDGECAIIGRQGAYCGNVRYFSGKAYMTEHAIVACAKPEYSTGYLAYKLSMMNLGQYQGQSAQPGLSVNTLSKVSIDMAPIAFQQKAFKCIKILDDKIENNNKINKELESMAKTIYDYWFLQFEFPNEEGKPYKSSGGKMVWNEELKKEIPEGWEVNSLGSLFTASRGISYNSKEIEGRGVPMINLASFNVDGSYKENGIKQYSGEYTADKVVRPFDLLMCNTQQTAIDYKKDIIGRAIIVPNIFDGDVVASHHVTTLRVKDENMKYFLYILFNTEYFHKYIAGFTNGTNILGLVFSGVEEYRLEIPDIFTLKRFADFIQRIEMRKSRSIKQNQELLSLREYILPLLMNGKVKIID